MENLRWILIFAGVGILVFLWFSGRSSRRDAARHQAPDPLLGDDANDGNVALNDTFNEGRFGEFDDVAIDDDFARPGDPASQRPGRHAFADDNLDDVAFDETVSPSVGFGGLRDGITGGLAAKFESIGAKLAPKRRQRVADVEPAELESNEPRDTKIVTLHVQAPAGEFLPREALYELFEQRGYHHGDMNIFHSLYEGQTVFSVARMVNPGYFDINDISTFETPGISFILQLPAPVAADTAFEVMLSEAFDMADALGATVLDGNHSTFGRQTEQHLRESIYEYMHRQKYADGVPG